MLSKFNQIFNKIMSECISNEDIISESVNAAAIQELINAEDQRDNITRKNFIISYIDTLLRFSHAYAEDNHLDNIEIALKDMTKKYIYGTKKIADLYPDGNYTEKNIHDKLVNFISSKYDVSSTELRKVFENTINKNSRTFSIFNFTPHRKSALLQKILGYIDANNITDNDIVTVTPDEFNNLIKDNNAEFSYAIFVKDNKVIGYAEVGENDGTIEVFKNHIRNSYIIIFNVK